MPKFKVQLDDGTSTVVEADSQEAAAASVQTQIDGGQFQRTQGQGAQRAPEETRGFLRQTGEQALLTASGMAEQIPGYLMMNIPGMGVTLQRLWSNTRYGTRMLDRMGAREATDSLPYGTGTVLGSLPAGGFGRAAKAGEGAVKSLLKELVPSGGAVGGISAAHEMAPDSPILEAVAGVGGALTTSIPRLLGSTIRSAFRGFNTRAYQTNLERMQQEFGMDIKITPTALADMPAAQRLATLENALAASPGARTPLLAASRDVLNRFKTKLFGLLNKNQVAASGLFNTDYQAGLTIQNSLFGKAGFVEKFHQKFEALQQPLNKALDQVYTPAPAVGKFLNTGQYIKGAPNSSRLLDEVPAEARPIAQALMADMRQTGWVPYGALARMRSMAGEQLKDTHLIGSRATGFLKQFYKALSDDMEVVAQKNGYGQRFQRINDYYSAGINRIETYLDTVNRKASPEDIMQWATSGAVRDSGRLAAVRNSMKDPEAWEIVRRQIVRRLGIPTKAKALGLDLDETFDVVEWAKNYTSLALKSPRSKEILFPGEAGANYDKIASTINKLRDFKSPLVNPNTIGGRGLAAALMYSTAAGAGAGAFLGNVGTGIIAGVLTPVMAMMSINGAARLMTNPKFVRWLGKSIDLQPGSLPGHLARIDEAFDEDDFEDSDQLDTVADLVDMIDYMESERNPEGDETLRGIADMQAVQ